jgi:Arc/MetJ-type ribon-helix-helix transcriptional regulator
MDRRLSVRLPDELARGIEARARRAGKTKSEVVRDALTAVGIAVRADRPSHAQLTKRAAAFRARQPEVADAAALVREIRGGSSLRLKLKRLTVSVMQADLA